MSLEENIITAIRKIIPRGNLQINEIFESDSEILQFNNEKLLVSIDTFSKEDHFNESDFYTLGWNLAIGGISDILASGGIPIFYGHSLTINKKWSKNNIENLTKGIKAVLSKTNTQFIGGDFGIQDDWSYTAVVLGKSYSKILLRSKAEVGDIICISGKVGAGNLNAAIKLFNKDKMAGILKNKFHIRMEESKLIAKYSNCCIDTSDGLFNALNSISDQSKVGYELKNIPYLKKGIAVSNILSLPHELLFLAECGEYELLFTIPKEQELPFFEEAKVKRFKFNKIGFIKDSAVRELKSKDKTIDLNKINIRARDFENIKEYVHSLIKHINEQKNE